MAETWVSGRPVFSISRTGASGVDALDASEPVRALLAIPVYRGVEKVAIVLFVF